MAQLNHLQTEKLKLIGEGAQGKVYQIDAQYCLKIYKKDKFYRRELACLQKGKEESVFPKVAEWGHKMMIREFIPGKPLSEYLKTNPITPAIMQQLLQMYHILERLKFKRLDTRLEHIIITPENHLRLIDPTNLMNVSESFPRRMLAGLAEAGCRKAFLKYVWEKEPRLAERWESKDFWRRMNEHVSGVLNVFGH